MAKKIPFSLDVLGTQIPPIFDQVSGSTANHRKNCVALYKLHVQATAVVDSTRNGGAVKLSGERAFSNIFLDMLNRVLAVKKGPPSVERAVKFIGSYTKFVTEKGDS